MKNLQFSIKINASKETVWKVLWDDRTFRDWSALIDEGTYMTGTMAEGEKVQFISSVSGYGVTSLIEKLTPYEFVLFKHQSDTQQSGQAERDDEWSGGAESYTLVQEGDITTLTVNSEVPENQEETFLERIPKAIDRVRVLAEA